MWTQLESWTLDKNQLFPLQQGFKAGITKAKIIEQIFTFCLVLVKKNLSVWDILKHILSTEQGKWIIYEEMSSNYFFHCMKEFFLSTLGTQEKMDEGCCPAIRQHQVKQHFIWTPTWIHLHHKKSYCSSSSFNKVQI